jgi:prepilin-type N-terminal cleavage/methylation domain-containing protein
MNRFALTRRCSPSLPCRRGFTLIEVLVATALSLMLLGAVIHLFGTVSTSITQSRAILESADQLRGAQNLLQSDLEGSTVTPIPPRRTEFNEGYLEIKEGPLMQGPRGVYPMNYTTTPATSLFSIQRPIDTDKSNIDTSVGDVDDIIMLTTRSNGKPFIGKFNNVAVESNVAEVAWFIRGNTLHRRQLLVAPHLLRTTLATEFIAYNDMAVIPAGYTIINPGALSFYSNSDISVRAITVANVRRVVPNTLADLTRREYRFAHPLSASAYSIRAWSYLGLPTSKETSDVGLVAGIWNPPSSILNIDSGSTTPNVMDEFFTKRPDLRNPPLNGSIAYPSFDYWSTNTTSRLSDSELIINPTSPPVTLEGAAVADDILLTNVIGFDVKVWDAGYPILQDTNTGEILKPGDSRYILPGNGNYSGNLNYVVLGFGGYVDLGYYPAYDPTLWAHTLPCSPPQPNFKSFGNTASLLAAATFADPRFYDTWSNTYDGTQATDGFDNGGIGIVDNDAERAFVTPYSAPIRGIQVIIRIFEPDSRQIREVTVEQDFLPK